MSSYACTVVQNLQVNYTIPHIRSKSCLSFDSLLNVVVITETLLLQQQINQRYVQCSPNNM